MTVLEGLTNPPHAPFLGATEAAATVNGGRVHQVGDWRFDAAAGELSRGDERRRLEDRAARTLEFLCNHRGAVVSQQQRVDAIWSGRVLSPNSIAVVITDLRRALGDDARDPRLLETVPKRGYRLIAQPLAAGVEASESPPDRRRVLTGAAIVALLAAGGLYAWVSRRPGIVVGVGEVMNQTGQDEYLPLARSVSGLTLTYLGRAEGLTLVRGAVGAGSGRRLNLQGRLAMWSGQPTVYFTAIDAASGRVVWSGMALGPEPALPANIDKALKDFEATLARRTA